MYRGGGSGRSRPGCSRALVAAVGEASELAPRAVGAPVRRSWRGSAEASCREPQPEHRDPDDEQGQRADQQQVRWAGGGKVFLGARLEPASLAAIPVTRAGVTAGRDREVRRVGVLDDRFGGCRSTGRDGPAAAQVELRIRGRRDRCLRGSARAVRCSRVDGPAAAPPRPPRTPGRRTATRRPATPTEVNAAATGRVAERAEANGRRIDRSQLPRCRRAACSAVRRKSRGARAVRGSARVTEAMATRSRWTSAQLSQLESSAAAAAVSRVREITGGVAGDQGEVVVRVVRKGGMVHLVRQTTSIDDRFPRSGYLGTSGLPNARRAAVPRTRQQERQAGDEQCDRACEEQRRRVCGVAIVEAGRGELLARVGCLRPGIGADGGGGRCRLVPDRDVVRGRAGAPAPSIGADVAPPRDPRVIVPTSRPTTPNVARLAPTGRPMVAMPSMSRAATRWRALPPRRRTASDAVRRKSRGAGLRAPTAAARPADLTTAPIATMSACRPRQVVQRSMNALARAASSACVAVDGEGRDDLLVVERMARRGDEPRILRFHRAVSHGRGPFGRSGGRGARAGRDGSVTSPYPPRPR